MEQQHRCGHDHGGGGEQAAPPPQPPPAEITRAVWRVVEQQQRDQEARQDEEALERQEATEPCHAEVVGQDDRHKETAKTVETRHVAGHARSLLIDHAADLPAQDPFGNDRCLTPSAVASLSRHALR